MIATTREAAHVRGFSHELGFFGKPSAAGHIFLILEVDPTSLDLADLPETVIVEAPAMTDLSPDTAWDGSAASWKERALMARSAHMEVTAQRDAAEAKLGALIGAAKYIADEVHAETFAEHVPRAKLESWRNWLRLQVQRAKGDSTHDGPPS